MNTQKHLRNTLLTITLIMTFGFGWSLAPGYQGGLFALTLVTMQAAALLQLPAMFQEEKRKDSGWGMLVCGGSVVAVVAFSVMASVATLSAAEDRDMQIRQQRETLQSAINGYMARDYVTRALEVQKELDALPVIQPTGLYSAAVRIEQVTPLPGVTVVNGFIVLVALMLDGLVILLSRSTQPVTNRLYSEAPQAPVTHEVTEQPPVTISVTPEVQSVIEALDNGKIERLSVRQVRDLLKCSQSDAMTITRTCKQLELKV
ncbi:hypothetical protein GZ77_03800 [Endozoicomonas montiporae]|uniref:Uncharacterized protein n=2 Tax=Endozoicomonas montiporae TaxID=1027273 RepID=A0A081NB81_9GAMM|nr:hypothetical protein [Endozoicomonas montiporae]AMO56575.1 hypothetical protein EZMO1_2491 [Endozoicomonas montiporae CL-33]KEQ15704.1 hypothetical protein GZ77_03800 [Endozoicomonas montiporae]